MTLLEFSLKIGSEAQITIAELEGQISEMQVDSPDGMRMVSGRVRLVGHCLINGEPAMTYALIDDDVQQ